MLIAVIQGELSCTERKNDILQFQLQIARRELLLN